MPEVQHLDYSIVLADLVIDQNRTMCQFANARSLPDCSTHARKISQELYMIEERLAKPRSGLAIIFGYAPDDFG